MFRIPLRQGKQKTPTTSHDGTVVSDLRRSFWSKFRVTTRRRGLLLLGIIVVIGLITGAFILKSKHNTSEQPPVSLQGTSAISDQVDSFSDAETTSLATSNPDPKKDLTWAYAKAQALVKTGDYQGAVKEYQAVVATGKAPYYVYQEYATAQAYTGDLAGARQSIQTAIDKLKADPSINSDAKTTEQHILNNILVGYQPETEK